MSNFNEFGLAEQILRALTQEGYVTPTPIQAQAIPVVVNGRDLIGIAQTGTGKTAAFALPILNRLAAAPRRPEPKTCRVLILSPTRELSAQILDSFRTYGRHLRVSATLAIGGVKMGGQIKALARGVDILVATPGRLIDLMRGRAVRLDEVEAFVLDEADRMLDMGFIHDIRSIVAKLPGQRQTLLFSATMPPPIAELAGTMLRNPVTVAVTPVATTAERIDQRVIHVDRTEKSALLAQILREESVERAIVFARTKHGADRIARGLVQSGIPAEAIHGNKSQGQRTRALADFKNGRVRTLVATDIAARGIDVDGISHVINFDLPHVAESYVHRIGRTARAGAEGIAISFCSGEERPLLRAIEKTIGQSIKATGEPGKLPSKARKNNDHRARGGAGHHGGRNGRDDQGRRERRHSDGADHRRDEKGHGRPQEPSERKRNGNGGGFMRALNSHKSDTKNRQKPVRFGARSNAERATASDH